jgi:hypothetical protein
VATLPTTTLEIEFDAGVWTNVAGDLVTGTTRRGRNRESGAFEAGTLEFTLRNDTRKYDPDHTAGPYYGKLRPNRRVRLQAGYNTITSLRLPGTSGAYASTPDTAALSITGDIDIRVKVALDDWTPAASFPTFVAKWNAATAQRSYDLEVTGAGVGTLRYVWSPDGVAASVVLSTAAVPFADGTIGYVRVTHDVNNGSGGNDVRFYTSTDGETWTQLGATVTTAGVTSIYDGTEPVTVGARQAGAGGPLTGNVYAVEIRNGIDGIVVASPSFDQTAPNGSVYGSTTLTDPQGNVWTRQGAASFATTATTYPIFAGYVDRIEQVYGGPNDATAQFSVTDHFKLLNRAELPPSVYAAEVRDDSPVLWWRLDEPAGSTVAADSSGNNRGGAVVGATTGAASLVVRDPGAAAQLAQTPPSAIGPGAVTLTESTPWAIELWLTLTGPPTAIQSIFLATNGPARPVDANYLDLQLNNATSLLTFNVDNAAGTSHAVNPPAALTVGPTYHLVFTHDSDRVLRAYVNGALAATGATTTGTFTITEITLGSPDNYSWSTGAVIDEFAVYTGGATTALSAARIAAHNTAGRTPWNGDLPGTRLTRIYEASAPGDYVTGAGTTTLQATDLGGTALSYAQKIEETERGWLFVSREGDVTFIGREQGITGAYLTAKAVLVDDDSGAGIPYRHVGARVDEADIVTRATISREGSVAITYEDAAAVAEFNVIDEIHEGLLHNSDTYSRAYAEWIVNTKKNPTTRIGAITLELTKEPAAMYPAILGLELADRVTYRRKPQNTGATIELPMRVEAIRHAIGRQQWQTTLQLSPFNPGGYPVFTWDVTTWDNHVWGL